MKIETEVTLDYAKNEITLKGKSMNAVLKIESKELRKMYFGKTGTGHLTVEFIEEPVITIFTADDFFE